MVGRVAGGMSRPDIYSSEGTMISTETPSARRSLRRLSATRPNQPQRHREHGERHSLKNLRADHKVRGFFKTAYLRALGASVVIVSPASQPHLFVPRDSPYSALRSGVLFSVLSVPLWLVWSRTMWVP